ncbi:hypothetical protein [Rhizorhabdus argentea]|uniref:hypothetical protein n=1 Tax=Rhizorhabdus argentea TaxID=1387174 RepID=UPI0030EFA2DD
MSVRIIIVLLALPLFLLLAGVNSLLLYREETKDMDAGLRGQAQAAAVTVADFAKSSSDPYVDLAQGERLFALREVSNNIVGLDSLYLIRPGSPPLNLIAKPVRVPYRGAVPSTVHVLGTWQHDDGHRVITALAPVGRGAMVVADVDAEPLARRTFHLKRLSIALIGGSAALAILLGLIVARRVAREFRRTRAIIDARDGVLAQDGLGILEVRELGDAIHLIDSSVAGELQRIGRSAPADLDAGIAAVHARHFPDISTLCGGLAIAVRTPHRSPAGCFHIVQPHASGCRIAIGEVAGTPAQALASAIALRDYVAAGPVGNFEQRLERAARAHGVQKLMSVDWRTVDEHPPLALHEDAGAAATYARRNPDLDPAALADDLAILFPDAGVIVTAKPAHSLSRDAELASG